MRGFSGLSSRVLVIMLFIAFVVEPIVIYNYLIGGAFGGLEAWLIIILLVEITSITGKALTMQEAFMINTVVGLILARSLLFPTTLLYDMFYAFHQVTRDFGYASQLPYWFTVPPESLVAKGLLRTFFTIDWVIPLTVLLAQITINLVMALSMGIICYEIYVVVEKLEFPLQAAAAEGIITVTGGDPGKSRVFAVSAFIGGVYAILSWFIPVVVNWQIPSLVYIFDWEFTNLLEYWRDIPILPGASLAININLLTFASGLVIPLDACIWMFIGSHMLYFIGNALLVRWNLWTRVEVGAWYQGAGVYYNVRWSQFNYWAALGLGFALAGSIVPIILKPSGVIKAFKSLYKLVESERTGDIVPLWVVLTMFISASAAYIILLILLLPKITYGQLLLLASTFIGGSFFITLISATTTGVTSYGFNIPYLREGIILTTRYPGLEIWFSPVGINVDGAGIAASMKTATMTGVKLKEFLTAYITSTVLGILSSFIFTQIYWSLNPIPSWAYPNTAYGWHFSVYDRNLNLKWFMSGQILKPPLILGGFIAGSGLYLLFNFLGVTNWFFAMLSGFVTYPNVALSIMLSALVSRYVFARIFGLETWRKYAPNVTVGLSAGWGIVVTLGGIINLISRSAWILPY
jgi:hypothetical protein